jgi:hypothetical protein
MAEQAVAGPSGAGGLSPTAVFRTVIMESDEEGVLSESDGAEQVQENPTFLSAVGRTIMIEPVGTDEEKTKFMGKSLTIAKLLQESPFAAAEIIDVRTNFKQKLISIQVKAIDMVSDLLQTSTLGDYPIKCYRPVSHWEIKGVITGIGVDVTEEVSGRN